MKTKSIFFTLFLIIIPLLSNAESVSPTFGAKIERPVDVAMIEGKFYYDVVVEIDAAAIDDLFKDGVKITVKSSEGKKIYKKRFSKSLLYGFSDGTIQVGKGNALTQLNLYKSSGKWYMEIREKGIY